MPARFYCPDLAQSDKPRLAIDEARHLTRVCRLGPGDVVEIFDGVGHATRAEVIRVDKDGVDLLAIGPPVADLPAPFPLTLASAVPKGERFDWLVEKATELGVERLIPIITERSVVEPGDAKLDRLRRTIIEASKQCGRNRLMILEPSATWEQVRAHSRHSIKLLADPQGSAAPQWPAMAHGLSVVLAVGPEGGFTDLERQGASAAGWLEIALGVNILRVETAGVAGCAALFTRTQDHNHRPARLDHTVH